MDGETACDDCRRNHHSTDGLSITDSDSGSSCTELDFEHGWEFCDCHIPEYSYEHCSLNCTLDGCDHNVAEKFALVVPHMHRCRCLIIELNSFDSAANFFVLLRDICASRLEELTIDIVDCSKVHGADQTFFHTIMMADAPVLKSVEMRGRTLCQFAPPSGAFQHLHLDAHVCVPDLSFDRFGQIHMAASSLTSLTVSAIAIPSHPVPPIEFPRLLCLQIYRPQSLADFCSRISTPALQKLAISAVKRVDFEKFMQNLRSQKSSEPFYPALRWLSFRDVAVSSEINAHDFMVECPSVTHLALINSYSAAFLNAILHSDTPTARYHPVVWSQLHTVVLSGCDYNLMVAVVYSRIAPGSSLVKLCLSNILYTLIPMNERKWLERHIEVERIQDMATLVET
jgi:hypothetical protein